MSVFDQKIVEDYSTNKRIAELLRIEPHGSWSAMDMVQIDASTIRIGGFASGDLYPDFAIRLDLAVMLPPPPGRRFELINIGDRTMIRYAPLEMLPSSTESWINCASKPIPIARAICRLWLGYMETANPPN